MLILQMATSATVVLGHAARGVTQRYIHIDEALMMTSDKIAEEIADLLDGRAPALPRRVRRADLTERALDVVSSIKEDNLETKASPVGKTPASKRLATA